MSPFTVQINPYVGEYLNGKFTRAYRDALAVACELSKRHESLSVKLGYITLVNCALPAAEFRVEGKTIARLWLPRKPYFYDVKVSRERTATSSISGPVETKVPGGQHYFFSSKQRVRTLTNFLENRIKEGPTMTMIRVA